jgi:alkanesulfonate monooxygenase
MDPESVGRIQRMFAGTDSVGQQRMAALHGGTIPADVRDLEIHPNLWAGLGLVRPGPGTAIVGSPETVLETIQQYRDAGIGTFIVSGFPLLEEAYRIAETILPHLPVVHDLNARPEAPRQLDEARHTWTQQVPGVPTR